MLAPCPLVGLHSRRVDRVAHANVPRDTLVVPQLREDAERARQALLYALALDVSERFNGP